MPSEQRRLTITDDDVMWMRACRVITAWQRDYGSAFVTSRPLTEAEEHGLRHKIHDALVTTDRHREQREKRLVEALRWYADSDNYGRSLESEDVSQIDVDGGEFARQALKGYEQ